MKYLKRISALILTLVITLQLWPAGHVWAADDTPQKALTKLRPDETMDKPIGWNEFDQNFINLKWDPVEYPGDASGKYINFYLQEINKPYRPSKPIILKERDVPGSSTSIKFSGLDSGTIYYAYAKAYHTHTVDNTTITSPESPESNKVKFLTDIDINAYSSGPKQITVQWDDVWDAGRRIDYKLYVSENKDFSGTPPIYINQTHIGASGPVKVNEVTGKLEYVHTVRDAGRVYYIKVEPDVADTELKKSDESKTVKVASFILVKTSRISTSEIGTVWRLDWTPVVTGLNPTEISTTYHIYRGKAGTNDVEQYMAAVEDTSFFVTVSDTDADYYYIIKAIVTRDQQLVYPDIRIESDKIYVKESEAAAIPPMPELVDEFRSSHNEVLENYNTLLKPDRAGVLWRLPKKGNGEQDTEVLYDIWLITDPDVIDNPPDSMKIATDVSMQQSNLVMDGTVPLGYKYTLSNLTPNTTYYFKIVAKKSFIEYVDDNLENVTYESEPALKVIITPSQGQIDQPLTPPKPPLQVKKVNNRDQITSSSVTIQLKNKWYEEFINGVWEYRTRQQLNAIDVNLVAGLESGTHYDNYRIASYDSGVTIDVGCIPYEDGMVYEDLTTLTASKIMGFPTAPNDPLEDADQNYDKKKHNVDIKLDDLEPNTTYIIWVRASRVSANKTSFPSEPIVVTTNPDLEPPLEKPTVPVINYFYAGDVFVDLGWDFKLEAEYNYYIKYGTSDDIESADGEVKTSSDEIRDSGKSYLRIPELKSNTVYYFWIQAEAVSGNNKLKSEWSDSYLIKTLPDTPPEIPGGFGVKNSPEAVTINSITYEWLEEPGMEYIIQVSGDSEFTSFTEYKAGSKEEYTVTGLRSNYRYYARLFAYDPSKKLRSAATQTVVCRTERSNEDYDSDEDVESIISGEFIIKDSLVIDHIWKVSIVGINADRLIEHMQKDNVLDYGIDLSVPPQGVETVAIAISSRVFGALDTLKENLYIKTKANTLVFRPGTLAPTDDYFGSPTGYDYKIAIKYTGVKPLNIVNLTLRTEVAEVAVQAQAGGGSIGITSFNKPLKVVYSYDKSTWYKEGVTSGYVYNENASTWEKKASTAVFDPDTDKGSLSFEAEKPGEMTVGDEGKNYFDDISGSWAQSSIVNVASKHNLKSVSGRDFDPEALITMGDSVKLMLDVLDMEYTNNFMELAAKSGIIQDADTSASTTEAIREKVISMAVRVYELKSGEKAKPLGSYTGGFTDMNGVSAALQERVRFAAQNGIAVGRFSDTLGPADPITRAEVMVMLERVLELAGEL